MEMVYPDKIPTYKTAAGKVLEKYSVLWYTKNVKIK